MVFEHEHHADGHTALAHYLETGYGIENDFDFDVILKSVEKRATWIYSPTRHTDHLS
jgi:hypothetical protein